MIVGSYELFSASVFNKIRPWQKQELIYRYLWRATYRQQQAASLSCQKTNIALQSGLPRYT